MLGTFFTWIFTILLVFFPLVFWLYIFTELYGKYNSRIQFFLGLLIGGCIVMSMVFQVFPIFPDIFYFIFDAFSRFELVQVFLLFSGLLSCIWGIAFLVNYIFFYRPKMCRSYFLHYLVSLFIGICTLLLCKLFIDFFPGGTGNQGVKYKDIVFMTFAGIVGYYFLIALIEEGWKYLGWFSYFVQRKEVYLQLCICVAWSVALGFAFFENLIYAYNISSNIGVSMSLVSVIFFRSIFAVALHILAGICMALWFYYVFYSNGKITSRLSLAAMFVFISIWGHAFYDIAISFWYTIFIFIYIIAIYFLLSYFAFRVNI